MKNNFYFFLAMMLLGTQAIGQATTGECGLFVEGPNATWTNVLVATTLADGAASQAAQSFTMNVTSLPEGGANYRVYKTTANGSDFFGNAQALTIGANGITVAGVGFDRAVKFQFSSGSVEFDVLTLNGDTPSCDGCNDWDVDGVCDDVDDCVGAVDDCGVCHVVYCYDMTTHTVSYTSPEDCSGMWISGTGGEMTNLDSPFSPLWNASCNDCAGVPNGGAILDALGECGGDCDADADGDGICDDEDDCIGSLGAGVRYVDEVFECVDVTTDITYAANVSVITTLQGLPPMALPQNMDVYSPSGDTETNRPLIIYLHTGNFLPTYLNGGATGDRDDNCAVEICSRFARMGYVVASIDYRLGWNPLAATQTERSTQLIGAAYRGVQDARTAVRYFRMDADVQGNTFGIDPTKVGYFGEGTGGYVAYAAATISDYNDIILDDTGVPISKFWYDNDGDPATAEVPMVIEAINGNPDATTDGIEIPLGVDAEGNPIMGRLCIGHYPDYSSDVSFSMNMGGALGDLNWLDQGDVPMVSFQTPHDPFAPYTTGVLIVPTTGNQIIEVSGAFDVHGEINGYPAPNNNEVFQSAGLSDPLSLEAIANGGSDGLFPVLNNYVDGTPTQPFDGAPWQWWDEAAAQAYDAANGTTIWATQMTLNPDMGPTEANMWIDAIQGYTAPRLALAMDLISSGPGCSDTAACNFNALATSDDGSCTYATPGYDCDGTSLNLEGCTDAIACNYDEAATVDNATCDYYEGTEIPTGSEVVWLVGLTLSGTSFEALAGGCEASGGVNPDVSINGVIVGDGSTPLSMAGISDPTGLLGDLAALASTVQFSICGSAMTVAALGNNIPMVGNGTFWISPIPVASDPATGAGQFLWAAPMLNFPLGCGQPTAVNYAPCELSVGCVFPGCTDENASNYDAAAGSDDGSCYYLGCTDATAFNYDADADTDDGSCIDVVTGCTDATASNFDSTANTDDGSCIILGCTYAAAENYNSLANDDDGSCTFSGGPDCLGDLDGDGVAATADLLLFLSVFGSTCN